MREAVIYATKILFRHPCDGSEKVDMTKDDVGVLRDFLLGGITRGHIEKPSGDESHATLSAIREALRKDPRLTGKSGKYKPERPGIRSGDEQLTAMYQLEKKFRAEGTLTKEKRNFLNEGIADRLKVLEKKKG
jgi:hypothetical protein